MLRELNVVSDISGRARNGEARPHPYPLPREREWGARIELMASVGEARPPPGPLPREREGASVGLLAVVEKDRAQSNCVSQERGRNKGVKL
jgi:hypothetical protein